MAIDVTCSGCGKVFRVSNDKAGKKGKCPGCGTIIVVPGGADAEDAPTPGDAADPTPADAEASSPLGPTGGPPPLVRREEPGPDMLWVDRMRLTARSALVLLLVLGAQSVLCPLWVLLSLRPHKWDNFGWGWAVVGYFAFLSLYWLAWSVLTWIALRMAGDPDAPSSDRQFIFNWAPRVRFLALIVALVVFVTMGIFCAWEKGPVRGPLRDARGDWRALMAAAIFVIQTLIVPFFIWAWGHFTTWAYQRLALQHMDE